jgi:hypothetical protein
MPTTPRGIVYPDSSAHTRLWEHLQETAESANQALDDLEGQLGQYAAYSAALSNISTSSLTIRKAVIGDVVHVRLKAVMSSAASNVIGIPLPHAASSAYTLSVDSVAAGQAVGINSAGGARVTGVPVILSTTTAAIVTLNSANLWNGANPFTWKAGDELFAAFSYERA